MLISINFSWNSIKSIVRATYPTFLWIRNKFKTGRNLILDFGQMSYTEVGPHIHKSALCMLVMAVLVGIKKTPLVKAGGVGFD
jgi:hypothetical protein